MSDEKPTASLGHVPEGRWEFDEHVTACFDDMLVRSIPQYDVMREACLSVAEPFVKKSTDIVDLGCSRGESMARLVARFGNENRHVGLEISAPMIEACEARFSESIKKGLVRVFKHDLRGPLPILNASVVQAILTLQFTPIEYRQQIVQNVYDCMIKGGAFVLVEKVLGAAAPVNRLMVDIYHELKHRHGYSKEEIDRKRMSLEGVLVPVTARWNEEMLRDAGFRQVDCFWRWMNFAGWLAVK